ncbi:MAG: cupredoxin domain-containing protein [Proteobacteria bacterium]|nr:cupredoxin domain-containing protein [Pseudomonadota bacterium]
MRVQLKPTLIRGAILAAALMLPISTGAFAAGEHKGGHADEAPKSGGHSDAAAGHGHGAGGHGAASAIGKPGKKSARNRVVAVVMTDNRFSMPKISVKKGETIRFIIRNRGEFVHEFNIGTTTMHKGHQAEMKMMVEHGALEPDKINFDRMKMDMGGGKTMMHNDPNSVLLDPGKSAEIVWTFTEKADLEFACNVPGHYESGMVGKFEIK